MQKKSSTITPELIEKYTVHLREQERAGNTIRKYRHDLTALYRWLDGRPFSKLMLMKWKEHLCEAYAAASVNSMLAAANSFLKFMGWREMAVKPLKIQRSVFCGEDKELTREEYVRLVETARREGNERLSLVIQALCATGIRVSELQFVTVEAVWTGRAEVNNKGQLRTVFLPGSLCRLLKQYVQKEKRTAGPVFVTRMGMPLDRSNVWRDMKKLCRNTGIEPGKVFPHNLRHLFARTYYSLEKDVARLADILGHSDVGTTRIYIMESGRIHARQIEQMGLVIT